jgi:hypothetical protein
MIIASLTNLSISPCVHSDMSSQLDGCRLQLQPPTEGDEGRLRQRSCCKGCWWYALHHGGIAPDMGPPGHSNPWCSFQEWQCPLAIDTAVHATYRVSLISVDILPSFDRNGINLINSSPPISHTVQAQAKQSEVFLFPFLS